MHDQKLVDIITQAKDKKKKPKPLNKIFKGATHKMANGTIMSGKTHTKNSKVLKQGKKKGKRRSKY